MVRVLVVVVLLSVVASCSGYALDPSVSDVIVKQPSAKFGFGCSSRSDCGHLPGLACVNRQCVYCRTHTDCDDNPNRPFRRCYATENTQIQLSTNHSITEALCMEKNLFAPFSMGDFITSLLAFCATALASGAGIGGGGVLVPLYILAIGLGPKHAIPLSKATIFGNSIAIFIAKMKQKHPLKRHSPVIDFDLALLMEPPTLIGTIAGVILNHVLPTWLILLMLVVLLSFTTYRTFKKAIKIYRKEVNREKTLLKLALQGSANGGGRGRRWSIYRRFDERVAALRWLAKTRRAIAQRRQLEEDEKDFNSLPPLLNCDEGKQVFVDDPAFLKPIHDSIRHREAETFPRMAFALLFFAWIVVFASSLLRGGHGAPSIAGIACGSSLYWVVGFVTIPVLGLIVYMVGYKLRLENRLKVKSNYPFVEGDIHWTKHRTIKLPVLCSTAGIAAGLLGIGGGMVKGPIMLEIGVLPIVQTATASFMILFTSSSTTLQFAIAGQYPGKLQFDYILWFAFIGFCGGITGQKCISYILKKYNRTSYLVFILAFTIGLSALTMGYTGLLEVIEDIKDNVHLGFTDICTKNH